MRCTVEQEGGSSECADSVEETEAVGGETKGEKFTRQRTEELGALQRTNSRNLLPGFLEPL